MQVVQTDKVQHLKAALTTLSMGPLFRSLYVNKKDAEMAECSLNNFITTAQDYKTITSFLRSLIQFEAEEWTSRDSDEHIVLSTIPGSKGLEYDHVIYLDTLDQRGDYSTTQGRNMLYVALSRAKQWLTILYQSPPSFTPEQPTKSLLHEAFGRSNLSASLRGE